MKITLVWPLDSLERDAPISPSYSIATLSKFLENNGFEVCCVDANQFFYKKWNLSKVANREDTIKRFVEIIRTTEPDLLGISGWSTHTPFVSELSCAFKKEKPDTFIVLGGYNPTVIPEEMLKLITSADCAIRGEGEYTLLELAKALKGDGDWRHIKGISYIDWDNPKKVIHTPDRQPIGNLDDLPFVDFENFLYVKLEDIPIMTSRSCPHACSFCSSHAALKKYRTFSIDYVIGQIEHLYGLYEMNHAFTMDSDFLCDSRRTIRILDELTCRNLRFPLSTGGRVDELNHENLLALKRFGLTHMTVSIEHILPKVLKFFNKSENIPAYIESIAKTTKLLSEQNVPASYWFMSGTPVENARDMLYLSDYIEALYSLNKNISICANMLVPDPGSYLWKLYLRGSLTIFRAEPPGILSEGYEDIPWANPENYLFENPYHSRKIFLEIIYDFHKHISRCGSTLNQNKRKLY
jgi:radical SAM superfamily enzyme YgiQ (UPF0313 family)